MGVIDKHARVASCGYFWAQILKETGIIIDPSPVLNPKWCLLSIFSGISADLSIEPLVIFLLVATTQVVTQGWKDVYVINVN